MIGTRLDLIIGILIRRRWLVGGFLCLFVLGALLVSIMLRPVYSAAALILIERPAIDPLRGSVRLAEETVVPPARIDAEIEIMRSVPVLLRVMERLPTLVPQDFAPFISLSREALLFFHIAPEAPSVGIEGRAVVLRGLRQAITVERRGSVPIIAVSAAAVRPDLAADIANAVAAAHIEMQRELKSASLSLSWALVDRPMAYAANEFGGAAPRLFLPDMRIVAVATPPDDAIFPDPIATAIVAGFAGSAFIVLVLFSAASFGRGLRSPETLARAVQAPVGVTSPLLDRARPDGSSHADTVIEDPLSAFSDGVRALRLMVQRSFADQAGGQMVVVTSASEGEGKTTTALALARAFDMAGQRVLLIDADVRSASLHRHLNVPLKAGFEELLAGKVALVALSSLVRRDPLSDVSVLINSGRSALPAERLFGGSVFAEVVRAAQSSFDVIIVDMPSAHWSGELAQILPHADAAVVVARWGQTEEATLAQVMTSIREAHPARLPVLPMLTLSPAPRRWRTPRYEPGYSAG